MIASPFRVSGRTLLLAAALAALAGCTRVDLDRTLARANADTAAFTAGQLTLASGAEAAAARSRRADELLAAPLGQPEAVQLALVNSPALQALLAQNWGEAAAAAQAGRVPNPLFTFERVRFGDALELGRLLSFGLLDLVMLPQRSRIAEQRIAAAELRLSGEAVAAVTAVRQAWVTAVAAGQRAAYAQQVYDSAEASAELARRMQAAGNFSRLERARQQAFYADAAVGLAAARQQALAAREGLVRALGLTDAQAAALKLPARLPPLPDEPHAPQWVGAAASQARLDIRLAQAELAAAAGAQRLNLVTSVTDIELGVRHDTHFDDGARSTGRGYEVSVRLPLFDWGDAARAAMNARTLAAAHHLEATVRAAGSQLRESYGAYRTAHDLARHYRDEVVPLRKAISEENLLRYNGMLIGVFELLADARDQVATVQAALDAEQQFWLADAALQAALIGTPAVAPAIAGTGAAPAGSAAAH